MRRFESGYRSAAFAIAALLAAYPRFTGAVTTTYSGPDGGLWSDPANWSDGAPLSNLFDAVINSPTPLTVQADTSNAINNFTLQAPNTLSILSGLVIGGDYLNNSGTILFSPTASAPILFISNSRPITGGGTILMTSSSSRLYGTGYPISSDNRIMGQGTIGTGLWPSALANSGTITASMGTLTLLAKVTNTGVFRADGGILNLPGYWPGIAFDNSNGTIEAFANSTVIGKLPINGGVIQAFSGGTLSMSNTFISNATVRVYAGGSATLTGISNSTLESQTPDAIVLTNNSTISDCIINSSIKFTPGSRITIKGLIINNAISSAENIDFTVIDNMTLGGYGTLTIGASSGLFYSPNPAAIIHNKSTIRANGTLFRYGVNFINSGTITASSSTLIVFPETASFINNGLLQADGGVLDLSKTFINTNGTIEALNGSSVIIRSQVSGGVLRTGSNGKIILNGLAKDLSLAGDIRASADFGSPLARLQGILTSSGTISSVGVNLGLLGTVTNSGAMVIGSATASGTISLSSISSIDGPGIVLMNNSGSLFTGGSGMRLSTNNHIVGIGILGNSALRLTNSGTITAKNGTLTVSPFNASDGFISTGNLQADGGSLIFLNSTYAISGSVETMNNGSLNFSSGIFNITGPILLNGGSADFKSTLQNANNVAKISGNGKVSVAKNATLISDGLTVSSLVISGSLSIRRNGADSGTTKLDAIVIAATTAGSFTSIFDLNDNKFILQSDYSIANDKENKSSYLHSALLSGLNGGNYWGNGISSATVAVDNSATGSHLLSLGLFDNGELKLSTFGGQAVDTNSLLIGTTLIGDTNLDQTVDGVDFGNWYAHVLERTPFNNKGDFNHDGGVDGLDFDLWFRAAGSRAEGVLEALGLDRSTMSGLRAPAPVPETGTGMLVLVVVPWLLRRSARRASMSQR